MTDSEVNASMDAAIANLHRDAPLYLSNAAIEINAARFALSKAGAFLEMLAEASEEGEIPNATQDAIAELAEMREQLLPLWMWAHAKQVAIVTATKDIDDGDET